MLHFIKIFLREVWLVYIHYASHSTYPGQLTQNTISEVDLFAVFPFLYALAPSS